MHARACSVCLCDVARANCARARVRSIKLLPSLQTLMLDLARSLEDRQDSANLQIAVLSFINVIINYKAGEVSYRYVLSERYDRDMSFLSGKSRVPYAPSSRVSATWNPTDY